LIEARNWQTEQPFSSRPAMFGSYLASVLLEDYEQGAALAGTGLLSSPDDFELCKLYAFSLARQGNVRGAARAFSGIDETRLSERQRIVWLATRGLIAFRNGDMVLGRSLYEAAISLGHRTKDDCESVARLYYAMEELRVASPNAETLRKEALDKAAMLREPSLMAVVEKVRTNTFRR
jgi:hypothetical protein